MTKDGKVIMETEVDENKIKTKLLSGRVVGVEKFEDKEVTKYYNESENLEKEEEFYYPEYMKLLRK